MTKTFVVTVTTTGYVNYTIEAEDEDKAADLAWDMYDHFDVELMEHDVTNVEELKEDTK